MARPLQFLTAGESHGPGLIALVDGLPAGVPVAAEAINADLARRQAGYGRGERQAIERDEATLLSGVRHGLTVGSPLALLIRNRDWENWREEMDPAPRPEGWESGRRVRVPRPGHADLAGGAKYGHRDLRNCLERASARETAARVAAGAVAKALLAPFQVEVHSEVLQIGPVKAAAPEPRASGWEAVEASEVRCRSAEAAEAMKVAIEQAREAGDSLGGVFRVVALGVPPGLGSFAQWDRRLDGQLAQALMSIPAVKGVEIGLGWDVAGQPGSQVHDEITYDRSAGSEIAWAFRRSSNHAGGLEGGVTNGEPLVLAAALKPIPTLLRPLRSVDLDTKEPTEAHYERSDVCVVPAAAVVGEAMVAWVLAAAMREKFGGDCLEDMRTAFDHYRARLRQY